MKGEWKCVILALPRIAQRSRFRYGGSQMKLDRIEEAEEGFFARLFGVRVRAASVHSRFRKKIGKKTAVTVQCGCDREGLSANLLPESLDDHAVALRLWIFVLMLAIYDYDYCRRKKNTRKIAQWFSNPRWDVGSFRWICGQCNMDPNLVWGKICKNPEMIAGRVKKLLVDRIR